jgi:TorA maturation chaperone TorD
MSGADLNGTQKAPLPGMEPDERMIGTDAALAEIEEIDAARAREYALLSTLLLHSPDAALIERLRRLAGDPTPLGRAHAALGRAAAETSAEGAEREYFALFVGLGDRGLYPYSSYYLTGFLQGRPLAALRNALEPLGIERDEGYSEPEDHVAFLLAVMASLVGGWIVAPRGADREFFNSHLAPWIGRFFEDLERAGSAPLYASIGALGRTFMAIEQEAFTLPG